MLMHLDLYYHAKYEDNSMDPNIYNIVNTKLEFYYSLEIYFGTAIINASIPFVCKIFR